MPTTATFQLREHGEELKARLRRAFDPAQPVGWRDGWSLAADAGAVLVPFLHEQLRLENRVRRRMLWIGALVLAAGTAQDDVPVALLASGRRAEERVFCALAVALLGNRGGSGEFLARHLGDPDEEIVLAATALALARYQARGTSPALARLVTSDDSLLAAAAALALARDTIAWPAPALERWFKERADGGRAELVRRAVFLNDSLVAPEISGWATQVLASPLAQDGTNALALAAALRVARHCEPKEAALSADRVPAPAALISLCSEPAWRRESLARGWLVPVPKLLATSEERRRLAVAYAASAGIERLRSEREIWQKDRDTAGPVVATLAILLLRARAGGKASDRFEIEATSGDERAWAEHAFGVRPLDLGSGSADPTLHRALQSAVTGGLSDADAAHALEAALMRSKSHPCGSRSEAFRLLVRDCLLLGSRQGMLRYGRGQESPGLPKGIPQDRDDFFETACEFYDFVSRRVPEPAPEPGLR